LGKVWVLDTETKGTGANMVPLDRVLKKPGSGKSADPGFSFPKLKPREPSPPEPQAPRRFKVVDVQTREVLAEDVDARATIAALELMREHCLRFLETRVELLAGRLSLSERISGPAPGLRPILEAGSESFPELADRLDELNPEEPYRRALTFVRERLRATARYEFPGSYADPAELLSDLRRVQRSLLQHAGDFTAAGDLHDVIRQVEVFGFHYAQLDIREHARVHQNALSEVFRELGICADYGSLDDAERVELLRRHIADRRPLIPADISRFSTATRDTIETFLMIHHAVTGPHPGAIQSFIISGTEKPAHLLEVLLLLKETSLAAAGGERAMLRIVPLFESGASLAAALGL